MVKGFKLTRQWQLHRRAHKKLTKANLGKCQRCGQQKIPHAICGNCGHYRDKKAVDMANI